MNSEILNNEEFVILTTEEVRINLPVIISKGIPVRRKKPDGTFGFIPPKDFDSYLKQLDMSFYIDKRIFINEFQKAEKSGGFSLQDVLSIPSNEEDYVENKLVVDKEEKDTVFANELRTVKQMNMSERIETLLQNNFKIKNYISEGKKFDPKTMDEAGKLFANTLCINKTSLEENIVSPISEDSMSKLVHESYMMIDNLINLMMKGKSTYRDLAHLDSIQTGSATLDHMNRMMIRFISFLFFYNSYFSKNSNEVKKFRAYFSNKYYPYYDKVFKGSQNISLEIVFKNGITPVMDRKVFIEFTLGSFMHDIGKLPEINYHDGSNGYDIKKARRHVFDSYNMLLEANKFTLGIVASGLLHHDYYGAPYGYNQLKTFVSKFTDKRQRIREEHPTKYFISYNILDVGYGSSLSYFPNKILEMLDVYDAMTDPDKKYRKKVFMPDEAVFEMKKEFLDKDFLGFDPIMFNIFVDFIRASGIVTEQSFLDSVKI